MGVEAIFGPTIDLLGKNIDLRAKNHNYISANLANVDTPGYKPVGITFESELKKSLRSGSTPAVSDPRHIPLKSVITGEQRLQVSGDDAEATLPGRDGNGVELDREMGRMVENQIKFNASIQLLTQKFQLVKSAIKGGS